jgi:acyl-CoA synthetase (AMP-forming)/AMP-acid ligase II
MTEVPTATTANELDPLDHRAETDGRAAPGVALRVVDPESGRPTQGEGEIQLRAPEMMLGYVLLKSRGN